MITQDIHVLKSIMEVLGDVVCIDKFHPRTFLIQELQSLPLLLEVVGTGGRGGGGGLGGGAGAGATLLL